MFIQSKTLVDSLKPDFKVTAGTLYGSSLSLYLSELMVQSPGVMVVLLPDPQQLQTVSEELNFFLKDNAESIPILQFPAWETLPYDQLSPHADIIAERLHTLYQLPTLEKGFLLVPISTTMNKLCPKTYLFQKSLILKKGQTFDLKAFSKQLIAAGYQSVSQVMGVGEFAVRGSILDVFPSGSENPVRVDCFDHDIDSIRLFEPESQKSYKKIEEFKLLPAREYPLDAPGVQLFRSQFRACFAGDPRECPVYLEVSEGHHAQGLEYYLPLFFETTDSLFDYLQDKALIIGIDNIVYGAELYETQIKQRFEEYRHDRLHPVLAPDQLFYQSNDIFKKLKKFKVLNLQTIEPSSKQKHFVELPIKKIPRPLDDFLQNFSGRILFSAESSGRTERLKEYLQKMQYKPFIVESWVEFLNHTAPVLLMTAPLEKGFISGNLALITEFDFFEKTLMSRRRSKAKKFSIEAVFQDLSELHIGSIVVHLDHGIGRYQGLMRLTVGAQEQEFMMLEYAAQDKLYVPITALNLISRYSGGNPETVALSKLGSDQWAKAKQKAIEQARDVAAELLEIYAKREMQTGFALSKPDESYVTFESEFPFEETPDQQHAIQAVIDDLTKEKPMDRVICGDVGFGKTEVALRAAFLVAQQGKQVVVLVPTTLLAEQHFQTFSDRFSSFPMRIAVISRFRDKKEQSALAEHLKNGIVDIVIATHKILYADIQFKNLGLVIIDEEHRFGVQQKERFKALRATVDMLTLTATPIPRTLNMAMAGLRDLSIIATPPQKRLSIKTFVKEKNKTLIQEAILREHHRGGQVYYLHNRVETIEREAEMLQELVPGARIAIAHGQMPERLLERVMSDFCHRKFNILLCTTIIETGIDIPTANTIIIDRADKFGLAQLHQLRGRVGRSHHQAYAFCLLPTQKDIGADALKRLEALSGMEELGSGFHLATQDLEIRGAGELLGESQSGNIQSVGFELYSTLLDRAIKSLKAGKSFESGRADPEVGPYTVEIDCQVSTLIPDSYLPDIHSRLLLYRRIANAASPEILEDLKIELIDRFGALPDPAKRLLQISFLKLKAQALGISKIEAHARGGRFDFIQKPTLDPDRLIALIQQFPSAYRLEGPQRLRFSTDLSDPAFRIQQVEAIIDQLY